MQHVQGIQVPDFWVAKVINSLNWLSSLLNDLARAIWRWTEKKMGRRSNADEGPVHSPMDRRHAKKRKREPNKKHNRTNKKQNKQTAANKNQNKRNVHNMQSCLEASEPRAGRNAPQRKKITDYSLSLPGHTSGFPHLSLNSFLLHPVSNKSKCLLNRFICCESFEVLSFHMSLNDDGE
jgi:hypothetical protein